MATGQPKCTTCMPHADTQRTSCAVFPFVQPRNKRSWDDLAHSARLTCACAASDCAGLFSK